MNEAQKPKRELKDVVGVFLSKVGSPQESSSKFDLQHPVPLETHIISFCSPFNEEETFALNLVFPGYLSQYFESCYLATKAPLPEDFKFVQRFFPFFHDPSLSELAGPKKRELAPHYFWVHWPDRKYFEEPAMQDVKDVLRDANPLGSSLIVLDLIRSNTNGFEHLIRIIDHLVLIIRPKIEDLKNAYKVMKTCHFVNSQLNTSIIFNAAMSEEEVEEVFAKFSNLVSQFLAIPLRCLGAHPFDITAAEFNTHSPLEHISLDSFFFTKTSKSKTKMVSVERLRFIQKLKWVVDA